MARAARQTEGAFKSLDKISFATSLSDACVRPNPNPASTVIGAPLKSTTPNSCCDC